MLASMSLITFILGFVNGPIIAWRILVGPVYEEFAILLLFVRFFWLSYVMLAFTEIMLIHVLMMYAWGYFCSLDEVFIFRWLWPTNW